MKKLMSVMLGLSLLLQALPPFRSRRTATKRPPVEEQKKETDERF